MAEIPSSSFIPRQNQSAVPTRIRRRRTFSIFNFIATTILIGSLILAGGTFFYKGRVASVRDGVKAELSAQEGLFNDSDILTVQRFDRQIRAAKHLLQNHIAPSKVFTVLENTTMDRIQFTSLDFTYDPGFEAEISVVGGTQEFKTVALQALSFGKEPLLTDAIFSEIGTAETAIPTDGGTPDSNTPESHAVSFSITGVVAPALLSYDGISAPVSRSAESAPFQEVVSQAQGDGADVITQDTL